MPRASGAVLGALNVATLLLSIPIIGAGIWLSHRGSTDCERFLQRPVIALGVFILLVSIAGIAGACCRNNCLLWIYLLVMFVLILLLFCFTVFAFVVTNKGAGSVVSGRGYKEYRLGDYSHWLQRRVDNDNNWRRIRSCLQDGKVCQSLQEKNQTLNDFINSNLSPIQSGCCKPPTACNFTYASETVWVKPAGFNSSDDPDCNTWSNDQSMLCYDCQSCKAGVLANLKHDWKKIAIVNIVFLVFLIVVYSFGCHTFRTNRRDNSYPGYKY
ncbi:tetraspanin-8-like [Ananas comosus]|uniref:Tetraspanin-8-like n=1 Tax=Ananas comosus TaxID=4615 RepID=A0A6P5GBT9_ANACO|nr:tetraspanin-8-like [Ananas comosus]